MANCQTRFDCGNVATAEIELTKWSKDGENFKICFTCMNDHMEQGEYEIVGGTN